jgi:hypothetical protein
MSLDGPKNGNGRARAQESSDAIPVLRPIPWAVQPEFIRKLLTELRTAPKMTFGEFLPRVAEWSRDRRVSACTFREVDLYQSMYGVAFSDPSEHMSAKTDTAQWRGNVRKFLEAQLAIIYANDGVPKTRDLTRLRPDSVRSAIIQRYYPRRTDPKE